MGDLWGSRWYMSKYSDRQKTVRERLSSGVWTTLKGLFSMLKDRTHCTKQTVIKGNDGSMNEGHYITVWGSLSKSGMIQTNTSTIGYNQRLLIQLCDNLHRLRLTQPKDCQCKLMCCSLLIEPTKGVVRQRHSIQTFSLKIFPLLN